MAACLHKHLLGHATRTCERHISKPLSESFEGFVLSLLGGKKDCHGNLRVVLKELEKKEFVQVIVDLDGAWCKLHEPFEGNPLKSANKQSCKDCIIRHDILHL